MTGGHLSDRKGLNLPDVVLGVSPLTDKDRADLQFGLDLGADWIALSFVQRPEDVAEARRLIGQRAAVIVKIEKPSALAHLEELIQLSDAVMVARGDLGVEMPPEDVPSAQKRIVGACRLAGKPVVVATQMLDSMVHAPAPTRAEASDVATAVYDGADAMMLSAESASGSYPVESVAMMNRIIARTERDPLHRRLMAAQHPEPEATAADAISAAAAQVAHTLSAAAIVTYTTSGSTTLRAARERPDVPILCLTSSLATARRLALLWGTHCVQTPDVSNFSEMVEKATRIAREENFAEAGQRLVVTAGVPFGTPGSTNVLRIAWVAE
jgi:pyruvate kinase